MPSSRFSNHYGIRKKDLKVKCLSCKEILPLQMFQKQDLSMLRKSQNALCKACRTVCRTCGTTIIKSTGERLQSRRQYLDKQLALSSKENSNNSGVKPPQRSSKSSHANLWAMDDETGEEKRRMMSGSSSRSSSSSSSSSLLHTGEGVLCEGCKEKEMIASTNVFSRFPMLKYKNCPFPVEKYRGIVAEELAEHRAKSMKNVPREYDHQSVEDIYESVGKSERKIGSKKQEDGKISFE